MSARWPSCCYEQHNWDACRTGIYGLGIADGVYMWRHEGIDAGELARMLMSSASDTVSGGSTDVLHGERSPRLLLHHHMS